MQWLEDGKLLILKRNSWLRIWRGVRKRRCRILRNIHGLLSFQSLPEEILTMGDDSVETFAFQVLLALSCKRLACNSIDKICLHSTWILDSLLFTYRLRLPSWCPSSSTHSTGLLWLTIWRCTLSFVNSLLAMDWYLILICKQQQGDILERADFQLIRCFGQDQVSHGNYHLEPTRYNNIQSDVF